MKPNNDLTMNADFSGGITGIGDIRIRRIFDTLSSHMILNPEIATPIHSDNDLRPGYEEVYFTGTAQDREIKRQCDITCDDKYCDRCGRPIPIVPWRLGYLCSFCDEDLEDDFGHRPWDWQLYIESSRLGSETPTVGSGNTIENIFLWD